MKSAHFRSSVIRMPLAVAELFFFLEATPLFCRTQFYTPTDGARTAKESPMLMSQENDNAQNVYLNRTFRIRPPVPGPQSGTFGALLHQNADPDFIVTYEVHYMSDIPPRACGKLYLGPAYWPHPVSLEIKFGSESIALFDGAISPDGTQPEVQTSIDGGDSWKYKVTVQPNDVRFSWAPLNCGREKVRIVRYAEIQITVEREEVEPNTTSALRTEPAQAVNPAATVRIGGWSLRANGQIARGFEYTGTCPVRLQFGWGVISTAPTTITYSFTRSDGGVSSRTSTADIPAAGRSVPVYTDWTLGANIQEFADFSGWEQLNIKSPNSVSQSIPFTIHCTGGA